MPPRNADEIRCSSEVTGLKLWALDADDKGQKLVPV